MDISISITVPFFGLQLSADIYGTYIHDTFEPNDVYIEGMPPLPTLADVSDFYSAHAEAIDEAVAAELVDHADAAADSYESLRQEEIDDTAERLRT